ncbi:hypothetical protein M2103_001034 [Ereboglobus sp. PH5-5]|uniref:hypothetical protein n=1 Tax=unclassified Ereboglobus TaxID=2626932 RepID=UPI00240657CD|nr:MULTISPECIES: hypothetical protein [unclassified Ereboglobus]MDF9827685.1 hypothetical protein [Ereboglobus sp. PH5-10]MDF9832820.1 hypothetical protein [Ereboglobus sp. PH5-5]
MRTALLFLLSALALALASGCASGTSKSAAYNIIPAGAHGRETSWTPTEGDIATLEKKLTRQFSMPDKMVISGIAEGLPPYSLSEYNIRYTGTGPVESRYILGEAVHKSLPEAATLLTDSRYVMPEKGGPRYFTVMYKPAEERIVAVRFNGN